MSKFDPDAALREINRKAKRSLILEFDGRFIDPLRLLNLIDEHYHMAFDYTKPHQDPDKDPLVIALEKEKPE